MATVGQELGFAHVFTSSSGTATDPTSVQLRIVEVIDGTELLWIYNVSPVAGTHYPIGMNPIVKAATGSYTLAFVSRKPERVAGVWIGAGTVNQTAEQTFFIAHSRVPSLEV